MEDAATAEISRAQIWQWLRLGAHLEDGKAVTAALVDQLITEEMAAFSGGLFSEAEDIFRQLVQAPDFVEFLTLPAYQRLEVPANADLPAQ